MPSVTTIHQTCPNCGSPELRRERVWYGLILGPIFMVVGFLLGIATLGVSFILTIWGIFLWMPKEVCPDCGYDQRES